MTHELEILKSMLDQEHIDWHDASDPPDLVQINRLHFKHRGEWWSVINGFGTYGGIDSLTEKNQGLLELLSYAVNGGEPVGWLTAEEVMKYVRGEDDE